MENEVHATLIELTNVKGIPHAELRLRKPEPGKGQLIALIADNGQGKSSFLAGVEAIFTGGHRPSMIRDGADKAEARMLLSDGTDIKRITTRKGYRLDIKTADGVEVKAPESYVKKLASGFGFDPIAFCKAKKEERLKYLMSVMPLEFTEAEILKAMGDAKKLLAPPAGTLDIAGVNKLVKDLVEKRGATGSRRDERAASVEAFRKTLASGDQGDDPRDWKAELAALEARKSGIENSEREEVREIEVELAAFRKTTDAAILKADDAARGEFLRLLELARKGEPGLDDVAALANLAWNLAELSTQAKSLGDALAGAKEATDKVRSENSETMQALSAEIATARAGADEQIRSTAIREQMEVQRKEARRLSAEWDALAGAIKGLEELRRSKLTELPVEGLAVKEDGSIFVDGRDFDEINQGARWIKSMEIGAVGVGELGLMYADEAEHLGPANWELLREAVVASGLTVIAARVASREEIEQYGPQLRSEPAAALVTA
ncbi:MAG: hypothetical protein ACLGXA_02360 [Acidobacteriota bacterium]